MATLNFPNSPLINDVYISSDGSSYVWTGTVWASGYSGAQSVDLVKRFFPSAFNSGLPAPLAVMMSIIAPDPIVFPSGLTGSLGYLDEETATLQADFDIQKNNISVATMRFEPGSRTPVFISSSAISLVTGDRLKVIAPAIQDATLSGIVFTLSGIRT